MGLVSNGIGGRVVKISKATINRRGETVPRQLGAVNEGALVKLLVSA